ncbi:Cysteine protease [Gryllus bimaculatus]|nr:Cysteine protease [Gryllus bimaculatus]
MTTDFLSMNKLGFPSRSRNEASSQYTHQAGQELLEVDGKVKTKLLSFWNNMKYGWTVKMKTNFSKDSAVWLLGKCYHRRTEEDVSAGQDIHTIREDGIEGFKIDFISRIWLTYRREFPILNGSNFTTDCGWGCMLRSGQMLMAQALVCHFLGRDWRWNPHQDIRSQKQFRDATYHRNIIKWFGDSPSHNSPLSIHMLVMLGEDCGKKAGDWYGPNAVAHMLRRAVEQGSQQTAELSNLNVYVAQDCAVYLQDVKDECGWDRHIEKKHKSKSLVLLIPLRLGIEKMNSAYSHCLIEMLSLPYCVGIIGGRPKHSLYFVGYQDDKLIHLDPHYCQPVVDVWQHDFPLSTFHCRSPRKMNVSKLDPSCCLGFYCKDLVEFNDFIESVQQGLVPAGDRSEYPMFVFCEGRSHEALATQRISIPDGPQPNRREIDSDDDLESEEFEIV